MHTAEELARFSEHLNYEIDMLHASAERLYTTPPSPVRNALLESFTIHARNLLQFFYSGVGANAERRPGAGH